MCMCMFMYMHAHVEDRQESCMHAHLCFVFSLSLSSQASNMTVQLFTVPSVVSNSYIPFEIRSPIVH